MILYPPELNYFNLFGFNLHYYSLCIFFAIIICYLVSLFLSSKVMTAVDKNILSDMLPLLVVFSIIGARIYYVLLSIDYFILNPAAIFMVWQGGLSIHGAIIGGIIFGAIYAKKNKINFFPYGDIICATLPLGQAIGRLGNFFNQEAFGMPTFNAPIKLYVSSNFRPEQYPNNKYFHPCFLYEAILDLLVFIILLILMKKTSKSYDGVIFFAYILLYSVVRAIIEPFRLDTVFYMGNIPFPLLISIFGMIIGVLGIIIRIRTGKESLF